MCEDDAVPRSGSSLGPGDVARPAALMAIVPHPDDEAFGLGGVWSRLAAAGERTVLITLTRGRGGRSLGLCPPERLGATREAELREAAEVLGISCVHVLDHHDFVPDGDRGIPRDPGLQAVDPERIVPDLVRRLDADRPAAVVTFGPHGSNGHPDHVATHRLAHAALARAQHRPRALYHYAGPEPFDGPARDGFLTPDAIQTGWRPPSHRIDLGKEELATKLRALACHRTQALSVLGFARRSADRLFQETFRRVDLAGEPVDPEGPARPVDRL
ncbi:MAG: PIG-L family deacetylase [Trueperaceae bacterium]